jgi:hypothetical protein
VIDQPRQNAVGGVVRLVRLGDVAVDIDGDPEFAIRIEAPRRMGNANGELVRWPGPSGGVGSDTCPYWKKSTWVVDGPAGAVPCS